MNVIVCGGRSFANYPAVEKYLDMLHAIFRFDLVIHGDNKGHQGKPGADQLADRWATSRHVDVKKFWAEWDKYGKSAGPIRNRIMIILGKPHVVIAFPGGKGTRNMMLQAGDHGIKVIDLSKEDVRARVEAEYEDLTNGRRIRAQQ